MRFASLVLTALLLASPLAAQTTQESDQTEGADAAAAEAQPAAPAQPEMTVEEIGDWALRCNAEMGDCMMLQQATDGQGNLVMEMSIVNPPEGAQVEAGVNLVAPLGSLLTEGIVIQIDGNQAKRYAFTWCERTGCFARFGLVSEDVAAMKRGAVAKVQLVAVRTQEPIVLEISLTGFTAAFDKLKASAQ